MAPIQGEITGKNCPASAAMAVASSETIPPTCIVVAIAIMVRMPSVDFVPLLSTPLRIFSPLPAGRLLRFLASSSAIRAAIVKGDMERANRMLGRSFTLEGEVIKGDERGTVLGFPTANLKLGPERVIPRDGIYATWALVKGKRYSSATSIGVRPTFGPGQRTIETYIIDFSGDLYGKEIALQFVERLRDEMRFDNAEALKAQMSQDVEQARKALSPRRQEVAR